MDLTDVTQKFYEDIKNATGILKRGNPKTKIELWFEDEGFEFIMSIRHATTEDFENAKNLPKITAEEATKLN